VLRGREFAGNRLTLNQDECEGRMLAVYADHARIKEDVLSSNGIFAGHHQPFFAVQDKPDWHDVWLPGSLRGWGPS